jgi:hypothetical protein
MEFKIKLSSSQAKELKNFCQLNSLNQEELVRSAYEKGIKVEMYGLLNNEKNFQENTNFDEERRKFSTKIEEMENIFQKEKNKLLEKIVELENQPPKEKIVEVIKEVVKENESDFTKLKNLELTLQKLKMDNIQKEKKILELETSLSELKNNIETKAVFLRGSNLNDKIF